MYVILIKPKNQRNKAYIYYLCSAFLINILWNNMRMYFLFAYRFYLFKKIETVWKRTQRDSRCYTYNLLNWTGKTSFKYNSYNQFDSRNSLMPVGDLTKEAWHAISSNLPLSIVNPSDSYNPRKRCSLLMASNTKKETWFLHRIHELILNTLVSESRGTWIARISSIETAFLLLLLFFLSFFLFFYLFVLKRFETTRARYFQNETFQRRRNVRRTRRCTLYVLCEWVCTCNYYFNGGTPGLPVRHFNFFPVTFSIFFFFILFHSVYFHFPSLYVTVYRHA